MFYNSSHIEFTHQRGLPHHRLVWYVIMSND